MYNPKQIIPIVENLNLDGKAYLIDFRKTFYPKFVLPLPKEEDGFPLKILIWQTEKPFVGFISGVVCGPKQEEFAAGIVGPARLERSKRFLFEHSRSSKIFVQITFKDETGSKIELYNHIAALILNIYVHEGELIIEGRLPKDFSLNR